MGTIALALLLAVVPPPARGAPGDDCRNAAGVLAPPKTEDVEEVVRAILAHRDRIPLSQHARDAIEKKNITVPQVMDVLKRGVRAPEEERPAHKRLTHVFEGQPEGQEGVLRVVVGLMDNGFPLVVTVMRVWGSHLRDAAGVPGFPKAGDVEEVVRTILTYRDRIPLSQHARNAIEERRITVPQVMDVLRRGVRAPEEERPAHKRLTHVFEGQPEGQEGVLRVVVGLMDDGFPLVVTVMRVWGDRLKKSLERLEEAARPAKERTAAGGR